MYRMVLCLEFNSSRIYVIHGNFYVGCFRFGLSPTIFVPFHFFFSFSFYLFFVFYFLSCFFISSDTKSFHFKLHLFVWFLFFFFFTHWQLFPSNYLQLNFNFSNNSKSCPPTFIIIIMFMLQFMILICRRHQFSLLTEREDILFFFLAQTIWFIFIENVYVNFHLSWSTVHMKSVCK